MMPDKWKNGITAIITLFTQSDNEFLVKHVRSPRDSLAAMSSSYAVLF